MAPAGYDDICARTACAGTVYTVRRQSYIILRAAETGWFYGDGFKKAYMAVFLCLAIVLSIVYAKLTPDIGKTDIDGKTEAVSGRAWAGETSNIKEGEPSEKYIAITFDDGPKAGTTDVLLEGLRQRGRPCNLFF